ncbi:DUF3990 domain-containing protein [Collinsella tanakaei]|uniref:DUF3990 domain-containing protein n=1 Tax=Collinsella tanakaei TaxID=626935 RepID=UPI0025A3C3A0|nr:DUF3990 domain-containing protein [Collinsella tanakaei]MDM8245223.1 DUF3990 domain-containing protein [Collinsella tanakaei]
MLLYHGSKHGISGEIAPLSRDRCDFGRGFYMGTDILQPLTLVCGYEDAHLYTVDFDISGLNVVRFESDVDWALYIAYSRGRLDHVRDSELYQRIAHLADGADVIVGSIANDRMFVVFDRFVAGQLTDTALVSCLSALNIGDQYVAKTEKACSRVRIVEDRLIGEAERAEYAKMSFENRKLGVSIADRIARQHRRDGRYFDEIIGGEDQ